MLNILTIETLGYCHDGSKFLDSCKPVEWNLPADAYTEKVPFGKSEGKWNPQCKIKMDQEMIFEDINKVMDETVINLFNVYEKP